MAAIGKIRSWGPVLVIILGVVLFFFIAEPFGDFIRSRSAASGQTVGEVLGERLSIQEYQNLVDEYQQILKMQGRDNLGEDEMNSLRDYIWSNYVRNKLVEAEAEKLGITVTDEEMINVLQDGTNPVLQQIPLMSEFINQSTGKFDLSQVNMYRQAVSQASSNSPQYAEQAAAFEYGWRFAEKTLRQMLLANKYQALLGGCMLSNPIQAKATFDGNNVESQILLAAMPYSSINDNEAEPTEAEIKAKYNEHKNSYKTDDETRDVKYVAYQVVASEADRAELMAQMMDAVAKLQSDSLTTAEVVRAAQSQTAYIGLPVKRMALSTDVAVRVDSMRPGQVTEPFENRSDNTLNVVKLVGRVMQADSVEFRVISIMDRPLDAAAKSGDSIMLAVKAGIPFDSIAKNYGQTPEKTWFTSANYQNQQNIDADTKAYFEALLNTPKGETKNLKLSRGNFIIQVTDRKGDVEKYDVAIIKRPINFSNDTYTEAFNKFSQYVSENQTAAGLEEHAADYGFDVKKRTMTSAEHNIANIHGTHDALKWLFDEAKVGQVSQVYDRCGDNDYLVVVALDKVNPAGYQPLETVEDALKQEVMNDKKFAILAEKLNGVTSISAAQAAGAKVDTVKFITFNSPVFVQAVGQPESVLSGAVVGTEKGQFSKNVVKGKAGAYLFQVLDRTTRDVQYDEAAVQRGIRQTALQQALGLGFQILQNKAKVEDFRYRFF
ncbi:MAG: SurA N-terminal domain-containing protein [Prevotella sp.]|nr:SurA N-terminal domain-containing protein [Prevotella sp.]